MQVHDIYRVLVIDDNPDIHEDIPRFWRPRKCGGARIGRASDGRRPRFEVD